MIDDVDTKTGELLMRVSSETAKGNLTLKDSKIALSIELVSQIRGDTEGFLKAMEDAFYSFCELDGNSEKRGFDFIYNHG